MALVFATARACGKRILSDAQREAMACVVPEGLTQLLLCSFSNKETSSTVANKEDSEAEPSRKESDIDSKSSKKELGVDFVAACVNALTELIRGGGRGGEGSMACMMVVSQGRFGALLVQLALRLHIGIEEQQKQNVKDENGITCSACYDNGTSEGNGRGQEEKSVAGRVDEENEDVERLLQMERALENLDALVYELSVFGTNERECLEKGGAGCKEDKEDEQEKEQEGKQGAESEMCEMDANGVYDFTSNGTGRLHGDHNNKSKNNGNSKKQGNHVDMAAIATSLLSKRDDAYDLNQLRELDGREKEGIFNQVKTTGHIGRSKQLTQCRVCSQHLLNHSYTLHCKCSFHPQCIVRVVGNKLMEGQEPKCPECFQPIE